MRTQGRDGPRHRTSGHAPTASAAGRKSFTRYGFTLYSISQVVHLLKKLDTCTTIVSSKTTDEAIGTANELLWKGFGKYNLCRNNPRAHPRLSARAVRNSASKCLSSMTPPMSSVAGF
ncbi:hypothetical protein CDL15_Pgr001633 [Punica granatum]|nr:hypothetical protein CDL15_Pgr001633 [Punica granatum]